MGRPYRGHMTESSPQARRGDERGLDRVIAFGDAVVAIAITLVVLPLVEVAMDAPSAADFLREGWHELGSAAISFVVIAVFWRVHHWMFAAATGYSSRVLVLEMVWLGTMVLIPVTTVLDVGSGGQDRLALGLYVGTLLVGSVALRVESIVLHREGFVQGETAGPLALWLGAALMALVLVLVLLLPAVGAWWLLLLVLEVPVLRLVARRGAGTD
jgi:uncharacterized membrane protein